MLLLTEKITFLLSAFVCNPGQMELERAKKFLCNFDLSSWKIILLNVHLVKENNPLQFKIVSFYLQFFKQFVIEVTFKS